MGLRASIDLKLELSAAFDAFVDELSLSLSRLGMRLVAGVNGRVLEGAVEVGRVVSWRPKEQIVLEWHPAEWQPAEATKVEFRFERIDDGTRITLEHQEWGDLLGDRANELAGWFASEVAAPLLRAMGPSRLGDWITDDCTQAEYPLGARLSRTLFSRRQSSESCRDTRRVCTALLFLLHYRGNIQVWRWLVPR